MATETTPGDIRLAYIIDNLKPDGAQTALAQLSAGLAIRGYDQRVYCLNDLMGTEIRARLDAAGTRIRVIGKSRLVRGAGLLELHRDLRRWRPDVLQTLLPFADVLGRVLGKVANVPVVVTSIRARNIEKHRWQMWVDRVTMRFADRVTFNNRQAIPFAMQHEGVREHQVVYIPNGVRARQQPNRAAALELRRSLAIEEDARVIGTIGRLVTQKDHANLLTAFSEVIRAFPDAMLLIIGDGPLRRELVDLAEQLRIIDRVRFTGTRPDVDDLLQCVDVYVQASLYEGMSNALMEAMAAARPVVATAVDGALDLIVHGQSGWLVPPGDSAVLAIALSNALGHREEAELVGQAAAKRVAREFSIDQMVRSYDALYRYLLAQKGLKP